MPPVRTQDTTPLNSINSSPFDSAGEESEQEVRREAVGTGEWQEEKGRGGGCGERGDDASVESRLGGGRRGLQV